MSMRMVRKARWSQDGGKRKDRDRKSQAELLDCLKEQSANKTKGGRTKSHTGRRYWLFSLLERLNK